MANLGTFLLSGMTIFINLFNDVPWTRDPVVLIHGITSESDSLEFLSNRIQDMHPGTPIYNIASFTVWDSLKPMWTQVEAIGKDIMNISANYPNGINLIGYSQGALIARAILQKFPQHNVRTFISLAGPQAGQYGKSSLNEFFPDFNATAAYEFFYTPVGQQISVGNYWNDPYHEDLYLKNNVFLPYINNEKLSLNSTKFKNGITKLNRMILIGGPDDGAITPWQSSHFGYFCSFCKYSVVEMRNRDIYKEDAIGLKTLDDANRLVIHSIRGVSHTNWVRDKAVIDNYILPYLN